MLSTGLHFASKSTGPYLSVRPLQSIGGGNDQRKPPLTRKVDMFVAAHFPSFSTISSGSR